MLPWASQLVAHGRQKVESKLLCAYFFPFLFTMEPGSDPSYLEWIRLKDSASAQSGQDVMALASSLIDSLHERLCSLQAVHDSSIRDFGMSFWHLFFIIIIFRRSFQNWYFSQNPFWNAVNFFFNCRRSCPSPSLPTATISNLNIYTSLYVICNIPFILWFHICSTKED